MTELHYLFNTLIFLPMMIGLAGMMFRIRGDIIWRFGVGSVALSLLGAIVAIVLASTGRADYIYSWSLGGWASHWQYNVGFKADFFAAVQSAIVAWLVLTSLLLGRASFSKHRSKLVVSLVLGSSLLGAVLANGLLSFLIFSFLSSFLAVFLLGLDKSRVGGADAVKLGATLLASELLLLVCVLGANKSLMDDVIFRFVLFGRDISGEAVLFFVFLVASFLKSSIPPLHFHWSGLYRAEEAEHLLPTTVLGGLGLYLFFRFSPELYPSQVKSFSWILMALGMSTTLLGGLYTVRARGVRAWLFASSLLFSGLSLSGFSALNSMGWLGGWIVYWFGIIALTFSFGLCIAAERRPNLFGVALLPQAPIFGFASVGSLLLLAGMPISVLYFGFVFVFGGATQVFSSFAWIALIVLPLVLGGTIYRLFFQFQAGGSEVGGDTFSDLTGEEKTALFPLLVFLLLTLLGSGAILEVVGRAVKEALLVLGA